MFRVPTRSLEGRVDLVKLRRKLTAMYRDVNAGTVTPVRMYRETKDYFYMPRTYGRQQFPDIWRRAIDKTVKPVPRKPLPIKIKPRDDDQQKFVDDIFEALDENVYSDVQATATTGAGKTATACIVHATGNYGRMLVLVHTNRLKEGWLGSLELTKGLRFFYGEQWVADNVGIVQQDVCDYEGKEIVIAMAPSLCSRRYPDEFYKQFSFIVIDEVHKMAAPVLSRVLGMFPAAKRLGLTATPRKGDMSKVSTAHLGAPRVISAQEVMKPVVWRVELEYPLDVRDRNGDVVDNRNSLITIFSKIKARQALLTDLIYWRGYQRGRQCLVLSDRTDQLLDFRRRLLEMGVADHDIGVYVGAYRTGKFKLTGHIEYFHPDTGKLVKLHYRGLPGFDTRAKAQGYVEKQKRELWREHGNVLKRIADFSRIKPEEAKPSAEDYERIEQDCPFVLATYGIFDTGIDIKRLDWGLEASPRENVEQAVGRCLRILPGKPAPEWYSPFDKTFTIVEKQFLSETLTHRYEHKTPRKLESGRLVSYKAKNAILKTIENPRDAIEKAKAAARKAGLRGTCNQAA